MKLADFPLILFLAIKMKCLLCKFKSNEKRELENHYFNFYNINKGNVFLRRLFDEKNNVFHGKRCLKNLFHRADLSCFMIS